MIALVFVIIGLSGVVFLYCLGMVIYLGRKTQQFRKPAQGVDLGIVNAEIYCQCRIYRTSEINGFDTVGPLKVCPYCASRWFTAQMAHAYKATGLPVIAYEEKRGAR